MSADIELQRAVSILSALDTAGVFGFFKSSRHSLSHPIPILSPLCLTTSLSFPRPFFPSFSSFISSFPFFPLPLPFSSFSPSQHRHKSSGMRAIYRIARSIGRFRVRGHRVETSNVGPVHGVHKDSCSKREKSKRKRREQQLSARV